MLPVFAIAAPLHSRKHQDFKLSEGQTSFSLEICEGCSLDDGVTVAKVSTWEITLLPLVFGSYLWLVLSGSHGVYIT